MPRSIWKGQISFGLVNIPITLFSAEDRAGDIHFHLLDSRDQSRVRYQRVSEHSGEEVPWDSVVKAYEYNDGSYVVLSDEDIKKAVPESTQTIEISDFVDRGEIDYVYFDKPYYLVPGKKGEKGYVLLREALRKADKVGIAKVVIRTKQYLGALMAEDDALVLCLLRFAQELRPKSEFDFPKGKATSYGISDREQAMAGQLVESMTSKWKPESYKDDFRATMLDWIKSRIKKGDTTEPIEPIEEEPEPTKVVDMMDLLKQSMDQRGKGGKAGKTAAAADKKHAAKAAAHDEDEAGEAESKGAKPAKKVPAKRGAAAKAKVHPVRIPKPAARAKKTAPARAASAHAARKRKVG